MTLVLTRDAPPVFVGVHKEWSAQFTAGALNGELIGLCTCTYCFHVSLKSAVHIWSIVFSLCHSHQQLFVCHKLSIKIRNSAEVSPWCLTTAIVIVPWAEMNNHWLESQTFGSWTRRRFSLTSRWPCSSWLYKHPIDNRMRVCTAVRKRGNTIRVKAANSWEETGHALHWLGR